MTAPHDPRWLELLAAYADGELAPDARAKVEAWLAAHPEAREELRGQRRYSPNNWPLWAKAEPKLPTDEAWATVQRGIEAGLSAAKSDPAPRRERSRWKFAAVAAGLVASASAAAWLVGGPAPVPLPAPDHPPIVEAYFGEFAALPVSSDADVDLLSVPGGVERWLPVGVPPLSAGFVLASADDVKLADAEPNAAWPGGMPKMTTAAGDAPMLFVTSSAK